MKDAMSHTLLRHTLATLAYRGGKATRGAPESFSSFKAAETSRTAGQILAHIGDLMDWGLSLAVGQQKWQDSEPQTWAKDTERFHTAIHAFDAYLASGQRVAASDDQLFQGPVADALTHVGQINLLRRLAGVPIKGENYFRADIQTGRVGAEQTAAKREF
jgi:hypothetical protein